MQLEELTKYNRKLRNEASNPKKKMERDTQKEKKWSCEIRGPWYNYYTSVNASRARILEQSLATKVMVMPKCANTPPRVSPFKHCQYRKNWEYSTEECMKLKDKIEDLIKRGCLKDIFINHHHLNTKTPGIEITQKVWEQIVIGWIEKVNQHP